MTIVERENLKYEIYHVQRRSLLKRRAAQRASHRGRKGLYEAYMRSDVHLYRQKCRSTLPICTEENTWRLRTCSTWEISIYLVPVYFCSILLPCWSCILLPVCSIGYVYDLLYDCWREKSVSFYCLYREYMQYKYLLFGRPFLQWSCQRGSAHVPHAFVHLSV